jgi:hypothetical protein
MGQDNRSGRSSDEPAEGRDDVPPPEQGSPQPDKEPEHGPAEDRVEQGKDNDPNPLAPPVNTQAGS